MNDELVDVVIAGGGPGGLSAALVLGRSVRKVMVIDEAKPRNAVTSVSHGFLTREGENPEAIRKKARDQLKAYPNIALIKDVIEDVTKKGPLFVSRTKSGRTVMSKKIVFATGMKDRLPDIPGLEKAYGKTVFHCPYCDGWERKNQPLALFGNGNTLLPFVKLIYNWSNDLIVFTNGPSGLTDDEQQQLNAHEVKVVETPVARLESEDGNLQQIVLESGEAIPRTGGFLASTHEQQSSLLPAKLGVAINDRNEYETEKHGKTSIDGVFIIGDAKNTFTSLIGAAGQGYEAAVRINGEFAAEHWAESMK